MRAQAQLQLSQMHCYTRYTQIKNRCIAGGKGRGVLSDFRLGRVCAPTCTAMRENVTPFSPARETTDIARLSLADDTFSIVPIPNQCTRRIPPWCEEGQLVEDCGHKRCARSSLYCEICVHYLGYKPPEQQDKRHWVALVVNMYIWLCRVFKNWLINIVGVHNSDGALQA